MHAPQAAILNRLVGYDPGLRSIITLAAAIWGVPVTAAALDAIEALRDPTPEDIFDELVKGMVP